MNIKSNRHELDLGTIQAERDATGIVISEHIEGNPLNGECVCLTVDEARALRDWLQGLSL